jgi:hypothetical protein
MGSTTTVRSQPFVGECGEGIRPGSEEVRTQLARLLASPLFLHSKHYPGLLRYVVTETLEGRGGHLKERALGVEVFGRGASYDTNADPVVRTSASEVRKRIAQYYHEPGHADEIRIDLPSGSYIPEFRYPLTAPVPITLAEPPSSTSLLDLVRDVIRPKRQPLAIAACLLALASVSGAAYWFAIPTSVERFWKPVWETAGPVMVALGAPPSTLAAYTVSAASEEGPSYAEVMRADNLAFADALALSRITGVSRRYAKKKLDVRRSAAYTLTDLRNGSVILVGVFNNPWTLRLGTGLRYYHEWHPDTHTGFILDRQNPANRSWRHDPRVRYSNVTQDYALVSRFVDPLTEKMVVVVGGMGRDGTIAASEFVSDPRYLDMLNARLKNWDKKNLQVVLTTEIVNGNTGPPRILAAYAW